MTQLVFGEQTITDTIIAVTSGMTRNNKAKWEVKTASGHTFVTFEPAIGQQAGAMQGQQVQLNVNVEQKGKYTNYYLNGIVGGAPGAVAQPAPMPAPAQAQPQQVVPPNGATTFAPGTPVPDPNEETYRIVRSTGAKAATDLLANGIIDKADFLKVSDAVALYLLTGKGSALTALGFGAPPTPSEVVAQVNAEAGAEVVQQGVQPQPEAASASATQGSEIPWG